MACCSCSDVSSNVMCAVNLGKSNVGSLRSASLCHISVATYPRTSL